MPADGIFLVYEKRHLDRRIGGTSVRLASVGRLHGPGQRASRVRASPPSAFPNPAIYAIGKGPRSTYTKCFHDIDTGDTSTATTRAIYYADHGYDLCTGWGTPTGQQHHDALAGVGTNDFFFNASLGAFSIVPGGNATTTLTVTPMNGFSGTINLAISGLPVGVTAAFSPVSTTTSSLLTLTVGNTALPSTNLLTVTATSGTLTQSVSLSLTVVAAVPGTTFVSLSSIYNRSGIWTDGRTFSGGLDGGGYAYSANLLGTAPSWNGITFNLGPANASDAVSCAGQTISLPAGRFNSLQILGTGVEGTQSGQTFTVTNTDNSTAVVTQSFSDWANPGYYTGESIVVGMPYRNNGGGSKDIFTAVNLYNYNFTLDQTKTVKTLTLPNNNDVVILALALANDPVTVSLASYYNLAGIYSDEVTFSNPATGGIDGGGSAYSATLLTGSQIWSNVLFNFGPANATNVVGAASQVIPLPPGNYSALRMLASGVQGSQTSQNFGVKYSDGTTNAFVQSFSDWYTPGNYSGETKAIVMGHRNSSNGTADNRTFYLYGYSFKLNSAKVVQSITLPTNMHVVIPAISLVPNWPPTFINNPLSEPGITAGQVFYANIATNASDLNGDAITFAKVSGPAWLSVSATGVLDGTPLSPNVGLNSFVVSATDPGGLSNTATVTINVLAAPPIISSITNTATNLMLNWTGGISPFQVQMTTNLAPPDWISLGTGITSNNFFLQPSNPAAFYQVLGE